MEELSMNETYRQRLYHSQIHIMNIFNWCKQLSTWNF